MSYKVSTKENSYEQQMAEFIRADMVRRDRDALLWMLGDERGRWFIQRLLDQTRTTSKCFTGNSTTFYNEGRRDVGLGVLASIAELGIEGVKLKQKGELEYYENQVKARELFINKEENEKCSKKKVILS